MKNKGFTLVELLAVIAILAILVIMALPAVLKMYSKARIDSFSNEVNTVAKTARQQYLLDGGKVKRYTNAEGSTNKLSLTGNSKLKYYVEMNDQGKIIKLQVTNGDYQYNISDSNGINVADSEDIDIVSELLGSDILEINAYGISGTIIENYSTDSGTYNTYQEAVTAFGRPFFIKNKYIRSQGWGICTNSKFYHCSKDFFDTEAACNAELQTWDDEESTCELVDYDRTIELSVGFIKSGNVYYLSGNNGITSFENNKTILINALGSSNCVDWGYSFHCTVPEYEIIINQDGVAEVIGSGMECKVAPYGIGCEVPMYEMG